MAHVAIVGAGIVGLACATALQMRGHALTLIDPSAPGEGCSLGNAGALSRASCVPLGLPGAWKQVPRWLADPAGPLAISPRYLPRVAGWLWRFQQSTTLARVNAIADALHPLLDCTIAKWRPLAAYASVPDLIRQDGYAFAYASAAGYESDALGRKLRRDRGIVIDVIEGPAIREFDPALSPQLTHLDVLPEQGHVPNPLRLSRALATRLRGGGASFVERKATGFDVRNGRVASVVTEGGDRIAVDHVVLAAGARSLALSTALGARVPLETERGYHAMLINPTVLPRIPVASGEGKYFATPMEGGLRIAGTVEFAGLEAPPSYRRADILVEGAKRLLPGLGAERIERWMGHRPSLPDSLPVIGRSPRFSNAFLAFGHGHVGLAGSAPTADLIADLVDGRVPFMDVAPFAAERFAA
ncbi:MAG TPA: FAD-binding oxidoreductase [Casimicrobiaceae bacterium]|nr:FAD-binding oxidoreductase [Casimicrobiaceae bacterium]